MAVKVQKPGLATTVQDLGRPGYYDVGIPLSGAMDRFALRCANLLVGNDEGAAALECVFMGPELLFEADAVVAVTGAELPPKLDGVAQPTWTAFAVKSGQVLSFDYLRQGARAYLAVAGGIDVPVALGSRSTYVLGALGGLDGRALKAGDTLPLGAPPPPRRPAGRSRPRSAAAACRPRPCGSCLGSTAIASHPRRRSGSSPTPGRWRPSRPHRLPVPRRPRARFRAAQPALRGRLGPQQHRRQLLSIRLDPGARRHRADRAPSRRGVGRRLFHARHRHFGRHGLHRPAPAARQGAVRARHHG